MWKFFYQVKWIHYENRVPILREAYDEINDFRIKNCANIELWYKKLMDMFEKKLIIKFPSNWNDL